MRIKILLSLVILIAAGSCSLEKTAAADARVDRVILKKSDRKLILMTGGNMLKSYKVALGRNPIGPKKQEGDKKTPEGLYIIDSHNSKSPFYLSLHISYPSASDREKALRNGVQPGGDIMIHGLKSGMGWIGPLHRLIDWTQGCIAVTNQEIEEIYALVPDGTPIDYSPKKRHGLTSPPIRLNISLARFSSEQVAFAADLGR